MHKIMSLHHSVVDMSADAPKRKWLSGFGQVQQTPFLPSKSWRAGQVKALLVMGGSCTTIHHFHLTPVQANRQEKVNWKRCTTWHCPQAVRAGEAHITLCCAHPSCGTALGGILSLHNSTTLPKRSNIPSIADALRAQALHQLLVWSLFEQV